MTEQVKDTTEETKADPTYGEGNSPETQAALAASKGNTTAEAPAKAKSRVEELVDELTKQYEADFVGLVGTLQNEGAAAYMTALQTLNTRIQTEAKAKADAEAKAKAEEFEKHAKARDAFKAHALDVLTEAWNKAKLGEGLAKFPRPVASNFVFRVERGILGPNNETIEVGKPVVLIGEVGRPRAARTTTSTATNGNRGGAKAEPLTVNGTQYESAKQAIKALIPAKGDAQMNRKSIISALKTAGHTVTE